MHPWQTSASLGNHAVRVQIPHVSRPETQFQGSCHEPAVTLQAFNLRHYLRECFTPETPFHVGKILPTPTDAITWRCTSFFQSAQTGTIPNQGDWYISGRMKLTAVEHPCKPPSLTGGCKRAHPPLSKILTPSKGSNPSQQLNSCQSDVSVSDPGWRCGFFYFQEFQKAPCPWSPKAMWRKRRVHLQNLQAPQNLLSQPNPERQRKSPRWRREAFVMVSYCRRKWSFFTSGWEVQFSRCWNK